MLSLSLQLSFGITMKREILVEALEDKKTNVYVFAFISSVCVFQSVKTEYNLPLTYFLLYIH